MLGGPLAVAVEAGEVDHPLRLPHPGHYSIISSRVTGNTMSNLSGQISHLDNHTKTINQTEKPKAKEPKKEEVRPNSKIEEESSKTNYNKTRSDSRS